MKDITRYIGDNYLKLAAFFKQIRQGENRNENSSRQKSQIIYKLGDDKASNSCVINLTKMFRKCGIISYFNYDNEKLNIIWNDVYKIRKYIKGEWLEHYAALVTKKIVSEYVLQNNLDYEVLMNVKLINDAEPKKTAHELDVVFRIGEKVYPPINPPKMKKAGC